MSIHMGIRCEECHTVHFVATSSGIRFTGRGGGMYQLACKPPCPEIKEFRKDGMRPYRVSEDVYRKGYAIEGEYEVIEKGA